jgi:hypothetical protein
MRAALVALTLVACSSASQPHRPPSNTGPPPVLGAAPRVEWRDANHPPFELTGLPAVARDGEVVVIALQDSDGGRGNVNLRLEIRDRADRVVDTLVVMTPTEYEAFVPDGEHATLPLNERVAAANRKLADLHAQYDLVPMRAFDAPGPLSAAPIEGDGFIVAFGSDHRLHVRPRNGVDLVNVDGSAWLAPTAPRCAQCPPCENVAGLRAFYKAPAINVFAVRIGYTGADLCWEPADQVHVVGW